MFNLVSTDAVLHKYTPTCFQACSLGLPGDIASVTCCGISWEISPQKQVCSKVTPWVLCTCLAQGGSIHSSGQGWYLDDGFLLGKKSFGLRALSIIHLLLVFSKYYLVPCSPTCNEESRAPFIHSVKYLFSSISGITFTLGYLFIYCTPSMGGQKKYLGGGGGGSQSYVYPRVELSSPLFCIH